MEQMSSEDMINSLKNFKCLSLQYVMSNVTEPFFVDVSIYVSCSGSITSVGKRVLICLLSFTCNFVIM